MSLLPINILYCDNMPFVFSSVVLDAILVGE